MASILDVSALSIDGDILKPSDDAFNAALHRFSALAERRPHLIAFPTSFKDVPKLIDFAKKHKLPLAVKGGGHYTGLRSASAVNNGLVIDLRRLNTVSVEGKTIRMQGGATWGEAYEVANAAGLDIVGGNVAAVGIGGFLTGGGHSILTSRYGLGVDGVLSMVVALADGKIVPVSANENQDLFWAIRGGGGAFGIVLEFLIKAYPTTSPIVGGALVYPGTQAESVIDTFCEKVLPNRHSHDHFNFTFARPPPAFQPAVIVSPGIIEVSRADDILKSLREAPLAPVVDAIHPIPSLTEMSHATDATLAAAPRRTTIAGSLLPRQLDPKLLKENWRWYVEHTSSHPEARACVVMWECFQETSGVTIDPTGTSFSSRELPGYVIFAAQHSDPAFDETNREWVRRCVKETRARIGGQAACPNIALGDETAEEIYGLETATKLRKLKKVYDPEGIWASSLCDF